MTQSLAKEADSVRETFHALLAKANKEHPDPADVKALTELLNRHKDVQLWRSIVGMGALAEQTALNHAFGERTPAIKECWKKRLEFVRADLGFARASPLERLLIQQVTLCWLNLNLTEFDRSISINKSIAINLAMYWEKRLTAAQKRFTRACESLARVRRLSRRVPVQVNIAALGGQQINMAEPPV